MTNSLAYPVSAERSARPLPLLIGQPGDAELTDQLLAPLWTRSRSWWVLFSVAGAGALVFIGTSGYTALVGMGVLGTNIPVAWAFPIINFLWWSGIAHAGTLLSAVLLLTGSPWRASINRTAEAMALIGLVCGSVFPILHLGRPWFFYWLVPYPSTFGVWPQFKSSLPWDVAAITVSFIVTSLFWYVGLLPDLASVRDRATGRRRQLVYGVLALGWRGSARQWHRHRAVRLLLAALAVPMITVAYSIMSFHLSITQLPAWHATLFPLYMAASAVCSGIAMLLVLLLPLRWMFALENVITARHLNNLGLLLLVTGLTTAYCYLVLFFGAWYGGSQYERYTYFVSRLLGPYAWMTWLGVGTLLLVPQAFWFRVLRTSARALFAGSLLILIAVWIERFVLIIDSLHRDFLPSSWRLYSPNAVDWGMFLGSIGLFLFLFLLVVHFVPMIAVGETKRLKHEVMEGRS